MIKLQLDEKAIRKVLESSGEEVKLELQNAIVQSFTNKYLKDLVNTEIVREAKKNLKRIISDRVQDIIYHSADSSVEINKRLLEKIDHAIQEKLKEYIEETIIRKIDEMDIERYISEHVEYRLSNKIRYMIEDELTKYEFKISIRSFNAKKKK